MSKRTYNIGLICVGLVLVLALGQGVLAKECKDPEALTYAAMSQERAPVVAKRVAPLLDYIAKVTGKKVEFYQTTSYAAQIEAMLGGFAEIANFGPFAYVLATEKDPNIEVFATYTVKAMPEHFVPGGPKYVGMLVSKKGSKFTLHQEDKRRCCWVPRSRQHIGVVSSQCSLHKKGGGFTRVIFLKDRFHRFTRCQYTRRIGGPHRCRVHVGFSPISALEARRNGKTRR